MRKTVVLGVTSGIAAFKSVGLVKKLKEEGFKVFVVMTKSATQMISPKEFEKVSEHKVYSELFEKDFDYKDILKIRTVDHIDIADKASVFVIAPATANIIAKIAHGIADDFLTTTILATKAPILVCPSMNVHMWENPVVQENIFKLQQRGFLLLGPDEGNLACGYIGKGRLPDIEKIKNEIVRILKIKDSLKDKKILITSGGTEEKIDDVRSITNKSSGKMGIAIAKECFVRGAKVMLLRSKNSIKPQFPVQEKIFETYDDLFQLITIQVPKFDILFHVAAVSDFQVKNKATGKLSSSSEFNLRLTPRKKILDSIKKLNPKIKLIAFKAKYGLVNSVIIESVRKRLKESEADAIIVNDISKPDRGFQADTNEVIIVCKNGNIKKIPLAKKSDIAKSIIDFLFDKKAF